MCVSAPPPPDASLAPPLQLITQPARDIKVKEI
jgi:hypothetical protein